MNRKRVNGVETAIRFSYARFCALQLVVRSSYVYNVNTAMEWIIDNCCTLEIRQ